MRSLIAGSLMAAAAMAALALIGPAQLQAADSVKTAPKPFDVTIRVFDPTRGLDSGQDDVLPVDGPDAEHAIASITANAASFTRKADGGRALPVAFTCVKVEAR